MTTAPQAEAAKTAALLSPSPTSVPRPEAPAAPPVRRVPLAVSGLLAAALTAYVWSAHGAKPGVLLLLGLGLGIALFHSRFGFTSAWRQLVAVGNGTGPARPHPAARHHGDLVRADHRHRDRAVRVRSRRRRPGRWALGLLVGAFVFAIGMQLGGACASGTLFAVGSGQTSIVLTLGRLHRRLGRSPPGVRPVTDCPRCEPVVLADHIGWFGSWAVTIVVARRHRAASAELRAGPPQPAADRRRCRPRAAPRPGVPRLMADARRRRGAGRAGGRGVPGVRRGWGVTSAFSLWGAEAAAACSALHPESWSFWQQPGQQGDARRRRCWRTRPASPTSAS